MIRRFAFVLRLWLVSLLRKLLSHLRSKPKLPSESRAMRKHASCKRIKSNSTRRMIMTIAHPSLIEPEQSNIDLGNHRSSFVRHVWRMVAPVPLLDPNATKHLHFPLGLLSYILSCWKPFSSSALTLQTRKRYAAKQMGSIGCI